MTLPYAPFRHALVAGCFWLFAPSFAAAEPASDALLSSSYDDESVSSASDAQRTEPAAYFIVGHQRLLQQIQRENHAWTLGDDGAVVAWARMGLVWVPRAIRRFDDASALSLHGENLQIYRQNRVIRVAATNLQDVAQLDGSSAVICGEQLSWRVDAHQRVCAKQGGQASVCASARAPMAAFDTPTCIIGETNACLSVRLPTGAQSWCLSRDNQITHHEHTNPEAVLHHQNGQARWLVRTFDGWAPEAAASAVVFPETSPQGGAYCFLAQDSYQRCSRLDAIDALDTRSVSSHVLQDVLMTEQGLYAVFPNGWYSLNAPALSASAEGIVSVRDYPNAQQRVWIDGEILGTGLHRATPHVAVCTQTATHWWIRDIQLESGTARTVSRGDGPCPNRADYHGDFLRLSFETRAEAWSLDSAQLQTADIRSPFQGAIAGELIARAGLARHCAHWAWDVAIESDTLGRVPLRERACARSMASTRWASDGGRSHGPALIMAGNASSFVFMIDEDTLESFTLRTRGKLSPRTRIHRSNNGSWLLSDPQTGEAHRFDARGGDAGSSISLVIGQRVWVLERFGILVSEDGHELLVTDEGLAIDGVGIGPVMPRTLTRSMQRLSDAPAAFQLAMEALFSRADKN